VKKVLFVCIGNCIRSQMAEAFARTYGRDVMVAYSAGVSPAGYISEQASKAMMEKGISLSNQYSKALHEAPGAPYDLLINISGQVIPLRGLAVEARNWTVADPMGKKDNAFEQAAHQLENLVMGLVLELRRPKTAVNRPSTINRQMPGQKR
jgi:arsenate reductase (thioredoxin)